jgi:hypothetical protein
LWRIRKERDHKEGLDRGGIIILKRDFIEIEWGTMDWNDPALDRASGGLF